MAALLRTTCTVVGAAVLYCALLGGLWYGLTLASRRRTRIRTGRRAAARAVPVAGSRSRAAAGSDRRSRPGSQPPSDWRDRPWAAAAVLLGAPSVRDRTAPFVDTPNHAIDWTSLLDRSRSWPPDRRLLVRVAYELASGSPDEPTATADPVTLADLARHVDEDDIERIAAAVLIRSGRLEPEDGIATPPRLARWSSRSTTATRPGAGRTSPGR